MLGDSGVLGCSGGERELVVAGAHDDHDEGDEGVVVGTNSGEDQDKVNGGNHEVGESSNCGGNRWTRQESLALLKIRSDMDAVFRDSNLKGPLWEEIARKLADLGYNRSAKKCKEKFENVYKYHKRTKEGRSTGKPEGKVYRFFDQLQAFESQPSSISTTVRHHKPKASSVAILSVSQIRTVPLETNPIFISQCIDHIIPTVSISTVSPVPAKEPAVFSAQTNNPRHDLFQSTISGNLFSSTTSMTSSSTASDQEPKARYKRKRKWKDFFRRIAKEVIEKQEKLQQKFLDAIDKQENERSVREEAWRMQEMARINREHEVLVRECSTTAANDVAIIAFLQKISGQRQPSTQSHDDNNTALLSLTMPRPPPPPLSANNSDLQKRGSFDNISTLTSSSRWPKAEVQALIRTRKSLELKYQESGPKGPMWEDISAGMRRLGYIRSAKRCKEKWENINKYFKKVKDRNLKRREDSKTCPYFQQLDALYKEKNEINSTVVMISTPPGHSVKPSNRLMEPLMVQPEQQWRPMQEDINLPQSTAPILGSDINHIADDHRENVEQNQEEDKDADDDNDQAEEEDGSGNEMVINKRSLLENVELDRKIGKLI